MCAELTKLNKYNFSNLLFRARSGERISYLILGVDNLGIQQLVNFKPVTKWYGPVGAKFADDCCIADCEVREGHAP